MLVLYELRSFRCIPENLGLPLFPRLIDRLSGQSRVEGWYVIPPYSERVRSKHLFIVEPASPS
ncbi:unnamed protein product [Clonostachys rosea f. rosea IK726]|uniref:Uncharacterized protein n=1 Tax=Clonostachys rosea f. rosea IK726 TaxID=1349383 RepID=A0ACA9TT42_BIOOC|nr:unnamed protein product [Clonostachys rosea f. rosea IK726]